MPVDRPSTPLEVVRRLGELSGELDRAVDALGTAEWDSATKRQRADLAESRAFLGADGPMELRKHTARVEAAQYEGEALVAEALVRTMRQRIRALETRIDIGRTYGATVRAELKTLGWAES